jgi:alpha-glucosidase (family GH31 glycosyl hydrolase)
MFRFNFKSKILFKIGLVLPMLSLQTGVMLAQKTTVPAASAMHPLANPKAVVEAGQARFTVLTPRLFRLEWTSSKPFMDKPTLMVINRDLPVPRFTAKTENAELIIRTDELELRYKTGSGKFNADNVTITSLAKDQSFSWSPGKTQKGNLKGTSRTLDNYDGDYHIWDKKKMELEDGLLATDGWTMIDDSQKLLFDNAEWPWVMDHPNKDYQDFYFFGYGRQYKKALYDYTQIAGRVPLPPRYAFGYWWSRYWSYSDNEMRDVVGNFKSHNVPLDVFVIDMDWHQTDSLRTKYDVFDQTKHWTGWTWNKRLFPSPANALSWMKTKNLKVTLNLHPASGVAPFEEPYQRMAQALNFDTSTKANIPYEGSNKRFMSTLFDQVLHPMEKTGVSFWWLDWQQWANDKKIPELNNTWWLNYVFFTDMERTSTTRPLLYHRWGGLGNHRYQLGFSGDAVISWKSLAFQPYFTSSASNVLYGYWSHDIGGHQFGPGSDQKLDPELYVRWMQYGALSPIFRSHSSKNANLNKEVWNFSGQYYDALKEAINLRYELAPYIYTMARKTYETGISLCRPLYYDYPNADQSYKFQSEYMFGDDMLIAPIVEAMDKGQSKLNVWLPEGSSWFEWNTGTLLKGGQEVKRTFSLDEYPIYVKAGAVVPSYKQIQNLSVQPERSVIDIFPGADGSASVYEDAGNSKKYATEYASTAITSKHLSGRKQQITINARKGTYPGMPLARTYVVRLVGAEMPRSILVNGKKMDYVVEPGVNTWNYDGKNLTVEISLPKTNCAQQQLITVQYDTNDQMDVNTGLVRKFRQLSKTVTALKFKDADIILPEMVGRSEETNRSLSYYPAEFYKNLRYFESQFNNLPQAIKGTTNKDNVKWFEEQIEQLKNN